MVDTGDGYPVVLVGVVHDHPASVHRARAVTEAVDPPTLAVELPDALVGLFASYAETTDAAGGEMTAAIDAAPDADVVGIDAPDLGSTRELVAEVRDARPSLDATARIARAFGRLVSRTTRGWLHAAGVPASWLGDVPGEAQRFDCSLSDPPAEQAAHETAHVRRSTSLLRTFEVPAATRVVDAARERYMARRLAALREESLVVAVVGFSHLEEIAAGVAAD
ncbi:hypothetical protein [Halobacterium sp. R2-5]|uniref:hypothetical protein n=1 Tax=Halobacterium sp. R2-5 TaxID=2715751 RepID=UPI001422F8C2|nr:hypothetical protein [Halobacterium sp. R2-5]NIB98548.1 hypothetical protein [Halobacterium sp. R2-5]